MMLVRHVIRDREPYSMNASATVQDAAEFMAARNVGAICIVDDSGKLLGVFSERDVLRRVVVLRRDPASVSVGEVTSVVYADVDPSVRRAAENSVAAQLEYLRLLGEQD